MSTDGSNATINLTLSQTIQGLLESYRRMSMPMGQYVTFILVPSLAFFLGTVVVAAFVQLPLSIRIPVPLLGLLAFLSAVFYPKILLSQRKQQLNNRFHLLVTHMTVLSTTNIDRMEVFRTLAAEEEYGELATEMQRIVELVDTWNQSLDDACRRRAREVPSDTVADFLERLAYTVNAGQSLQDYLLTEQDQIIKNYTTTYESTLDNLDVLKDLYLSMILSMTFALVFAIVLPILSGVNPTLTVVGVIVMFMFVQFGFFFVIRTMAPYDPVWYFPEARFVENRKLWGALGFGGLGSMILVVFMGFGFLGVGPGVDGLLFFLETVPLPVYIGFPVAPLLVTGIVLRNEEQTIHKRDNQFPNFIRSLGSAEHAKQATTSAVLETLRTKDFGALSPNVNRLYRRLGMRLNPDQAWGEFSIETRSYLIQKFSEMFLVGRQMGGNTKLLGEVISSNMNTVNQLRTQRKQATTTLIGLLYGITAAATFAFFIGLEVVNILADFSTELEVDQFDIGQIIHPDPYNIPLIEYLLLLVILYNAALSSVMIRTIDGGNKATAYIHFVMMTWLGCLVAIATREVVSVILAI